MYPYSRKVLRPVNAVHCCVLSDQQITTSGHYRESLRCILYWKGLESDKLDHSSVHALNFVCACVVYSHEGDRDWLTGHVSDCINAIVNESLPASAELTLFLVRRDCRAPDSTSSSLWRLCLNVCVGFVISLTHFYILFLLLYEHSKRVSYKAETGAHA